MRNIKTLRTPSTIIFFTTNNLATNPRLVKGLKKVLGTTQSPTVVQFKLGNWSDSKSEELRKGLIEGLNNGRFENEKKGRCEKLKECKSGMADSLRVQFINIEATSEKRWEWLRWGIYEKVARWLYPLFKTNLPLNALASSRRSWQLLTACRRLQKPKFIIAHNLGALYPAYQLSKTWDVPFIFDVEDYHPGEFIRTDAPHEQQRRELLMKQLLPHAAAITSASPLIGEYTLKLIGGHQNHQVILNSFPQDEFIAPTHPLDASTPQLNNTPSPLRLIWFSQKVSFGRGLEQLFDALSHLLNYSINQLINSTAPQRIANSQKLTASLTLTLIGDLDPAFNTQILQPFIDFTRQPMDVVETMAFQSFGDSYRSITPPFEIVVKPPLTQQQLHHELANHDVGLALEFNNTDLNRQLCLTNKILAYAQAGLYILATDTPAQKEFMTQEPSRGRVCGQTAEEMANALIEMLTQKDMIQESGMERFEKGKALAWKKESDIFTNLIEKLENANA